MEDEKYERLVRIFEDCNLSYGQIVKEGQVNFLGERVDMELQSYKCQHKDTADGLVFFLGLMLQEIIPNVEEWKQRATRMGMETTHVDALVDLRSNKEDAPPLPLLKEEDHEPMQIPTCPNIDSWLESNMRNKHEEIFDEIERLISKVHIDEFDKDELNVEIFFLEGKVASCEEDKEIQSLPLYGLQLERRKMPQVEDTSKESINLSLWHERLELIFQSIMMAVLRNWKKKKKYVKSFHFCNNSSSLVSYSHSLKLTSVLEKREIERRWWKKKKWREKCM